MSILNAGPSARTRPGGGLLRLGVIADPQYAPVPPQGTRHYAASLGKMAEAVADLNAETVDFTVTLGDIIDRGWDSFGPIMSRYADLAAPRVFVLGNHDHNVAAAEPGAVRNVLGIERAHRDFAVGGHRFLVIDGTEISLFAAPEGSETHALARERLSRLERAGADNAKPWNGGISEAQFAWIEERIREAAAAGERVIAMGHFPLYPKDMHNMWDDARLTDLFAAHDNVVLYINGHNHAGNYGKAGGTHFLNLKGMVETPDMTAYSVLDIHEDRVEVHGRGRERSRILGL